MKLSVLDIIFNLEDCLFPKIFQTRISGKYLSGIREIEKSGIIIEQNRRSSGNKKETAAQTEKGVKLRGKAGESQSGKVQTEKRARQTETVKKWRRLVRHCRVHGYFENSINLALPPALLFAPSSSFSISQPRHTHRSSDEISSSSQSLVIPEAFWAGTRYTPGFPPRKLLSPLPPY